MWIEWDDWLGRATPCTEFELFPYDQPWYVLFSSGTTGKPKAIVHRAGGVLLKHLSEHLLHTDIRRGDVVFQFTTTGWMMWNWAVSALASGATVVSYDGSPFHPGPTALWDVIDAERVTMFGTSAKYLDECAKVGLEPRCHTGSTRSARSRRPARRCRPTGSRGCTQRSSPDAHLASVSGGTDLCGCLVAGYPTEQVRAGVIQGPALGVAADVVDDDGTPVSSSRASSSSTGRSRRSRSASSATPMAAGTGRRTTSGSRAVGTRVTRTTRTADGGFVIHGRPTPR